MEFVKTVKAKRMDYKTKTAKLVHFFVKICFLPITYKEENIDFKFWSWRSLVFLLYTYVPNLTIFLVVHYYTGSSFMISNPNTLVIIISVAGNICTYSYNLMPLIIASGLKGLDKKVITENHNWPKEGYKMLVASLSLVLGNIAFLFSNPQLSSVPTVAFVSFVIMNILFTLYFTFPSLMISILFENFNIKCKLALDILDFKNCIKIYRDLEESLRTSFFCHYTIMQLQTISFIFVFLTNYLDKAPSNTFQGYMEILGYVMSIVGLIYILICLTESTNRTFDTVQKLREEIIEKLGKAKINEEVQQLEYLKNKFELLKPMNASGYFDIEKSTLTSMLSVR